jgi:hypothetical protein
MSNINPNNIDGTYPIAGQDNDSQGFRDNFTNIRNNFSFAQAELDDIAAKGIFKSALVGSSLNNNMAGAPLTGARIRDFREERIDNLGAGPININVAAAHYQTMTTSGPVVLSFSGWPASGPAYRVRLDVTVTDTAHTITLPAAVTNAGDTPGVQSNVIAPVRTGTFIYEFVSFDGGNIIKMVELTSQLTESISDVVDVNISSPVDGQVLRYQGGEWVNTADGVGDDGIGDLSDVAVSSPTIGQLLSFDGTNWVNADDLSLSIVRLATNTVLSDTVISSGSVAATGLGFAVEPGKIYKFEALVPFETSSASVDTTGFTVEFSGGTCVFTVEQQAGPTDNFVASTHVVSGAQGTVLISSSDIRLAKVSGVFNNTTPAVVNVGVLTEVSDGTLTIKAGANLVATPLN